MLNFKLFFFAFILFSFKITAQNNPTNPYNLKLISTTSEYKKLKALDINNALISLKTRKGLILDLRYASSNNFMKKNIYPKTNITFLRKEPGEAILRIITKAKALGYGIKIFDAYRPYQATIYMWELVKNEDYAANPKNGSGHNRGAAIDLTLFNLKTGKELNMGTGFDDFSEKAHHGNSSIAHVAIDNRLILKSLLENEGFNALSTEWWHYSWPNAKNKFDLMDFTFKQLKKLCKKVKY